MQGREGPIAAFVWYTAFVNLLIGAFNLLPAFPLDGGRMLRSAIWAATGSLQRATSIAAVGGQFFGVLLMVGGAIDVVVGGFWSGLLYAMIGWFLFATARSSRPRSRLGGDASPVVVPSGSPLMGAADRRNRPPKDAGITGIETAILLIAVVVVATVFAVALLGRSLLATEQQRETVAGGLQEGSTALVLRGSVMGLSTTSPTFLNSVSFQITNAARGEFSPDLSDDAILITYQDSEQVLNLSSSNYTTTWLGSGSGDLLDSGERVEFELDLRGLNPRLGANTEFTIQIQPRRGGVLTISRTTPAGISGIVDLR